MIPQRIMVIPFDSDGHTHVIDLSDDNEARSILTACFEELIQVEQIKDDPELRKYIEELNIEELNEELAGSFNMRDDPIQELKTKWPKNVF